MVAMVIVTEIFPPVDQQQQSRASVYPLESSTGVRRGEGGREGMSHGERSLL